MKITNNFEVRRIANEIMLIPKNNTNCTNVLVLNKMAAEIYELVEETKSDVQIVEELFAKYDVDILRLKEDVTKVLRMLTQNDVVNDECSNQNC